MGQKQTLLHHFLAALAYRTQKALRGAPAEFASFRAASKVRTPHELIRHMDDVLGYSRTFFIDRQSRSSRVVSPHVSSASRLFGSAENPIVNADSSRYGAHQPD